MKKCRQVLWKHFAPMPWFLVFPDAHQRDLPAQESRANVDDCHTATRALSIHHTPPRPSDRSYYFPSRVIPSACPPQRYLPVSPPRLVYLNPPLTHPWYIYLPSVILRKRSMRTPLDRQDRHGEIHHF